MKATVIGLVTPHLLRVLDIAKQAETGANVDWHLRDAVAKSIADLSRPYNATDLLAAYLHGLETAVEDARAARKLFVRVALQTALAHAQAVSKNAAASA